MSNLSTESLAGIATGQLVRDSIRARQQARAAAHTALVKAEEYAAMRNAATFGLLDPCEACRAHESMRTAVEFTEIFSLIADELDAEIEARRCAEDVVAGAEALLAGAA